jgi:hypothetical protein
MDAPMPSFTAAHRAYQLIQVDTGVALYSTCATTDEILFANENLRRAGNTCRFFPHGSFISPSLHDHAA